MENFFFVHVPKSAGASFRNILLDLYKDGAMEIDPWLDNSRFLGATPVQMGHMTYDQVKHISKTHEFIVFLRHPVERVISSYYYCIEYKVKDDVFEGETLLEYAKRHENYQTFFTGGDLNKFSFVGLQEYFNESIDRFSNLIDKTIDLSKYDKKNICHIKESVSNEDYKSIVDLNIKDFELYEEALSLYL